MAYQYSFLKCSAWKHQSLHNLLLTITGHHSAQDYVTAWEQGFTDAKPPMAHHTLCNVRRESLASMCASSRVSTCERCQLRLVICSKERMRLSLNRTCTFEQITPPGQLTIFWTKNNTTIHMFIFNTSLKTDLINVKQSSFVIILDKTLLVKPHTPLRLT